MEFHFELPEGYSYQDVLALMRVLIRKRKIGRWVRLLSRIVLLVRRHVSCPGSACAQWNTAAARGHALLLAAMIVAHSGCCHRSILYTAPMWRRGSSWRVQAPGKGRTCICLDDSAADGRHRRKERKSAPTVPFRSALFKYRGYWISVPRITISARISPQTAMTTGNPESFAGFLGGKDRNRPLETISDKHTCYQIGEVNYEQRTAEGV